MLYVQELSIQIEEIRSEMERKAAEKNFNFLDSEVLELSELLDFLILKKMKIEELIKACS